MHGASVAFFDAYPHQLGGAQHATALLAAGLRDRGRRVVAITPGDGAFPELLRARGIPVVVLAPPPALARFGRGTRATAAVAALPRWWARLARLLRRSEVDLVHGGDHRGMVLAAPAARLARTPFVWHLHALEPGSRLDRFGAAASAAVVVPSRRALEVHPALGRRRSLVAPYPARSPAGSPTADPVAADSVVACLARVHPSKGLELLVRALAALGDAEVVIAGDCTHDGGAERRRLAALAAELGVADRVRFVGHLDDPSPVLAGAAVYAQPSVSGGELLPLAVIEAAAAGLPVVATDVGAMAELVRDGETGFLVPSGDLGALVDRLGRLLDDRAAAARMGAAGADLVALRHDPDAFVASIARFHDGIVGAAG